MGAQRETNLRTTAGRRLRLAFAATCLVGAVATSSASAATFTVNRDGDESDASVADGRCDSNLAQFPRGLQCTLRAAIDQANATDGRDVIAFNLPASSDKTISPATQLPSITDEVAIDGYTQPGAAPNSAARGTNATPVVALDGAAADPFSAGLFLVDVAIGPEASDSEIRGLIIKNFGGFGIDTAGDVSGLRIQGNFIGTDRSGTQAEPNGSGGIFLAGSGHLIGGAAFLADRNLISGNDGPGALVFGDGAHVVQGNLIGTAANGSTSLGNAGAGVDVLSQDNVIGGDVASAANVINGNGGAGVAVGGDFARGNSIVRNSIFRNAGVGIDLDGDGITLNDGAGDPDFGPNRLQNFPRIRSAVTTATPSTTVQGELVSTGGHSFRLHFYANPSGRQGKAFIGTRAVTTDAAGRATFTFSPGAAARVGDAITATATDLTTGDTSEFSPPEIVAAG